MSDSETVADSLARCLLAQSQVNGHTSAPVAAVLWPDKDGAWAHAIPRLQALLPGLLVFGPYAPALRQGPAIWLKCAIAGALPELGLRGVPIVYLPGVSRTDLRAIESCSRDLQPLAELQYRGVFWSQSNGKDWTVNAFLTSKNGGLGLSGSQDKATLEALAQVLAAGVLLDRDVQELKNRQINAEWLQGLLAPNPTRDLLVWMNDAAAAQQQWGPVRWSVFQARCKSDFGFDPVGDGPLVAAERLAKGAGKWAAVAELYKDSHASFPKVYGLLVKVQPPQLDLFGDTGVLAGYPQANESQEASLRYRLAALGAMTPEQARAAIQDAEREHGMRRGWLWAAMGEAPLAQALRHLADLASGSAQVPSGTTPDRLAKSYSEAGWKVDAAALRALGTVHAKSDVEATSVAVRAVYLPWTEEGARRLQDAVKAAGYLGSAPAASQALADGICTIFVDGLRYDAGAFLCERLAALGEVKIDAGWTSMPSVTASGKAWCSPVAEHVSGAKTDLEFEPHVAADGKPLSGHNFRKLLVEQGVQVLARHELGDPSGCAWTEVGDLDHYGHEHGIRLARDLDTQLSQVVERIAELQQAGWKRFRIVTDHGWLLMPGGLPKSTLPKHQAETRWGRCAVLKDTAHGTPLTFGWDWCKDVQVAYAPGASSFIAGSEYAHGGLSLQECLVPCITLETVAAQAAGQNVTIQSITWKGLRCVVTVVPAVPGLTADIRTKAALPSSSLVASVKPLEGGKANLAVADDDHLGVVVAVVVLNQAGEVVQKATTTVGE
jgi:hypothetical protein